MAQHSSRRKAIAILVSHAKRTPDPWTMKGDFIDQEVDPHDASALLTALSSEARALLAQVVAMHLARGATLPPLSVPPALAHLAEPLLAAGWLEPCDEDQYLSYDDDWGPVPVGWRGVALSWKGIAAILAVLSDASQLGSDWLGRKPSTLRRFGLPRVARRFPAEYEDASHLLTFPMSPTRTTVD